MRVLNFLRRVPTMIRNVWRDLDESDSIVSMAPIDNIVNGESYYNAIADSVSNKKIRNIGVIGKNGVGKSSVIAHYLKHSARRKYKIVSLADFEVKGKMSQPSPDEIERSVLQQLFYKTSFRKLPASRFRRINHFSGILAFIHCLVLVTLIYIVSSSLEMGFLDVFVSVNDFILSLFIYEVLNYASLLFFYGVLFSMICRFYYILRNNYLLSRIGSNNFEIKNKDDNKANVLNENFDEIMYFFKSTRTDLVIFEDLDRLEDVGIIVKLREICDMLNSSETINFKVTFIYALTDTLFNKNSDDKTKFFDYLITVLPTVTASNSYIELNKLLEKRSIRVDKKVLSEVMIYVNDMRSVKNIYNDFMHFRANLSHNQLDDTKLLCFIVYKNLHPQDYADIQKGEGILNSVVNSKKAHTLGLLKVIETELTKMREELSQIKSSNIKTIRDIRKIYLFDALGRVSNEGCSVSLNGQYLSIEDLLEDKNFNQIGDVIKIGTRRAGFQNVNFDEILNKTKPSYEERVSQISKENESAVEARIDKLVEKQKMLRRVKVQTLLNEAEELEYQIQKNVPVDIMYMLKKGYISEDFNDYIIVIDTNDRSYDDISLIRNHQAKGKADFFLKLKSFEKVFESFEFEDFKKTSVYNIDFVDYLIKEEKVDELTELLSHIKVNQQGWSFLDAMFDNSECKEALLKFIVSKWESFWDDVNNSKELTYDEKLNFFIGIFSNGIDIEEVNTLNKNNNLTYFTEELVYIEEVFEVVSGKELLKEFLQINACRIENLYDSDREHPLVNFLVENNLYSLSFKNLNFIDENISKSNPIEYLLSADSNSRLDVTYIRENIEYLIDNLIFNNEESNENQETYIELLEMALDSDFLFKIVLHLPTSLEFKMFSEGVLGFIFDNFKATNDLQWLEDYMTRVENADYGKIAQYLSKYVDYENTDALSEKNYQKIIYMEEKLDNFGVLTNSIYKPYLETIDFSEIPRDKFSELIREGMFKYTEDFLVHCLKREDVIKEHLIESYYDDFMSFIRSKKITNEIHMLVYRSHYIDSQKKHEILQYEFDQEEITVENLSMIFGQRYDKRFGDYVLNRGSNEFKIIFANTHYKGIDNFDVSKFITSLGSDYSKLLIEGKRPGFGNTDLNRILLNMLNEQGVLGEVYTDGDVLRAYVKRKKTTILDIFKK